MEDLGIGVLIDGGKERMIEIARKRRDWREFDRVRERE